MAGPKASMTWWSFADRGVGADDLIRAVASIGYDGIELAEEARGYKLAERNGQKYYCRTERVSGSHLKTMNCITENELRVRVENAEANRRQSKASVCAPNDARCGGL